MKVSLSSKMVLLLMSIVLAVFIIGLTSVAIAQETEMESDEATSEQEVVTLEGMVVVGTRAKPRSVLESAVPIDVLSSKDFVKQGEADLSNLLRNLVPSYNVNTQPISDGGTIVRPANLRGLAPDHTLVLVNGKRRHRAAVITWFGNGLADGSQGPDISVIPSIALKQVEVLRDGASAQYGSDAIAGVLNFQLKDSHQGGAFEFKPGIHQQGDGELLMFAGNLGFGREDAWGNLSLEYGYSGPTIRSVQRADAAELIAAGNADVADPAQIWGKPEIRGDLKSFINYGATLTDTVKVYGHANYAAKTVEGGFYFRNPNTRLGVFSNDGGETLLIGDLDGVGQGGDCVPVPIVNNVPDSVALAQIFSDPNCFSFQERFPGGFTPRFGADTSDIGVLLGLKGGLAGLGWDVSASYGRNEADFFINNTVNASLGPDTPTEFDPGTYIQDDVNLNLDVSYPLSDRVFLASGLEYRIENFETVKGQIESYQIAQPLASQGFSVATNGFPGFSELAEGKWERANAAMYLETEFRPINHWLINAAVRGERFASFGTTLNYKLATNFGVTDIFQEVLASGDSLPFSVKTRASYSTGFRAPTPGQQNAYNTATDFDLELNELVNKGTIPSTSRVAELKGGKPLTPEESQNFTLGAVLEVWKTALTVDYFNIQLTDRLALSKDFDLDEQQINALLAEGITNAGTLQGFRFFINDFATTTQGIDVVLTAPVAKGSVSLVYNYTGTEVVSHTDTLSEDHVKVYQEGVPKHRGHLKVSQSIIDNLNVLGRLNYYSSWWDAGHFSGITQTYGDEWTVDVEVTYVFENGLAVAAGGQNILNEYSDENELADILGNKYSQFSPFGFSGAFWYTKIGYSF